MIERIEPEFVDFIPDDLVEGILYISMEYATATHLCCCGCGERVVTPFTPTDWRMTYDGETVSLRPSIGNWEQACQTHYVIDRNRIVGHGSWDRGQVERERQRDRLAKAVHYGDAIDGGSGEAQRAPVRRRRGVWSAIWSWLSRK